MLPWLAGPHTFQRYEAWQLPMLAPAPAEALKLLHRLAADPGIVGIMQKHRWVFPLSPDNGCHPRQLSVSASGTAWKRWPAAASLGSIIWSCANAARKPCAVLQPLARLLCPAA